MNPPSKHCLRTTHMPSFWMVFLGLRQSQKIEVQILSGSRNARNSVGCWILPSASMWVEWSLEWMDKSFATQGLYLGTELQQITEALCDPEFHRGLMLQTPALRCDVFLVKPWAMQVATWFVTECHWQVCYDCGWGGRNEHWDWSYKFATQPPISLVSFFFFFFFSSSSSYIVVLSSFSLSSSSVHFSDVPHAMFHLLKHRLGGREQWVRAQCLCWRAGLHCWCCKGLSRILP